MGFAKIYGELTSRVGRPVRFGAPKDVQKKGGGPGYGTIVDEVWADPKINKKPPRRGRGDGKWGDYSFCGQLIKWEWGKYTVRLAYFRRRWGKDWWEYASQATVNMEWPTAKALMRKTLAKKAWFTDYPKV